MYTRVFISILLLATWWGSTAASQSNNLTAATIQPIVFTSHHASVHDVCFANDSQSLVSGDDNGDVIVWDLTGAIMQRVTHTDRGWVNSIAVSPDGRQFAAVGSSTGITIWDSQSGLRIDSLPGNAGSISSVAFSSDGRRLATGGSIDGRAMIWDLATRDTLMTFLAHRRGYLKVAVQNVEFSRDGNLLLTAGDDTLARLWDLRTRVQIDSFPRARRAEFSADNRLLVTTALDSNVTIWNIGERRVERSWIAHSMSVTTRGSFNADGTRLLTAGRDGSVKVWDAKSGKHLITLVGHTTLVTAARFSPNGRYVAAAGLDSTVLVWDLGVSSVETMQAANKTVRVEIVPNPTSKSFRVTIIGPTAGLAMLQIIDIRGKTVRERSIVMMSDGRTNVEFDSGNLPSGTYRMRLENESWQASANMIIAH